jgi:hypothetical protein
MSCNCQKGKDNLEYDLEIKRFILKEKSLIKWTLDYCPWCGEKLKIPKPQYENGFYLVKDINDNTLTIWEYEKELFYNSLSPNKVHVEEIPKNITIIKKLNLEKL